MSVGSKSGAGGADADAADADASAATSTRVLVSMARTPCLAVFVAARIRRRRAVGAIDVELIIAVVVALTADGRQRDVALLQRRRGLQVHVAMLLQADRRGLQRADRRWAERPELARSRVAVGIRLRIALIAIRQVRIEALRERGGSGDCEQRRRKCNLGLGHVSYSSKLEVWFF